MQTTLETPSTELTLPQRAAVALGTLADEKALRELAAANTDIVEISNKEGRDQVHRCGMVLLKRRTGIEAAEKTALADSVAFQKAVREKRKTLIDIIEPEEKRLFSLRDGFDAKVEQERLAKIAAERARVDSIKTDIQSIRDMGLSAVGMSIDEMDSALAFLDEFNCTEERFMEFGPDASRAVGETMDAITTLYHKAIAAKALAEKLQAEREAEAARVKAQAEENERVRAELAAQKSENERIAAEARKQAEAERAAQQAALDKELAEKRAEAARIQALEDDKRRFEEQKRREEAEAEHARMQIERANLASAQAEIARKQESLDEAEHQRMLAILREKELRKADDRKLMLEELAAVLDAVPNTYAEAFDSVCAMPEGAIEVSEHGRLTDAADEVSALETWPARIWLQSGADEIEAYFGSDDGEVTWCEDRINYSDIEYIRADRLAKLEALHTIIRGIDLDDICGTNCVSDRRDIADALAKLVVK